MNLRHHSYVGSFPRDGLSALDETFLRKCFSLRTYAQGAPYLMPTRQPNDTEQSGLDRAIDRFLKPPATTKSGAPPASDPGGTFDLARLPVAYAGNQPSGQSFKSPTFIVTFGSQTFNSIDWSFGGLRMEGFLGVPSVGNVMKVTIQDPRYRFGAVVRVFWISRSVNQFVAQFTALQPETITHLKQLAQLDVANR